MNLFIAVKNVWTDSRYAVGKSRDGPCRSDGECTCVSRFLQALGLLHERRSNVFAEQAFQFFVRFAPAGHDDGPLLLQCPNPSFELVICLPIRVPPLPEVFEKIAGISNRNSHTLQIRELRLH